MRDVSCLIDKETYEIRKALDEGGNAYSFRAWHKVFQKEVFIKIIDRVKNDMRSIAEPSALISCRGRGIAPILHAEFLSEDYTLLVMEWVTAGSLTFSIKENELSVRQSLKILVEISEGLAEIHSKGFLHRDLKPGNILFDGVRAYITDFGTIAKLDESDAVWSQSRHSALYVPPEVIAEGYYRKQSDVYQLGIVLFEMLNGSLPYENDVYVLAKKRRELIECGTPYESMDATEKNIVSNQCVYDLILAGKILDFGRVMPWIPRSLRKLINDMTALDWRKRPVSASAVAGRVASIEMPDWRRSRNVHVLCECSNWRGYDVRVVKGKAGSGRQIEVMRKRVGTEVFRRHGGQRQECEIGELFDSILTW